MSEETKQKDLSFSVLMDVMINITDPESVDELLVMTASNVHRLSAFNEVIVLSLRSNKI
jgi:hypothetical protein